MEDSHETQACHPEGEATKDMTETETKHRGNGVKDVDTEENTGESTVSVVDEITTDTDHRKTPEKETDVEEVVVPDGDGAISFHLLSVETKGKWVRSQRWMSRDKHET